MVSDRQAIIWTRIIQHAHLPIPCHTHATMLGRHVDWFHKLNACSFNCANIVKESDKSDLATPTIKLKSAFIVAQLEPAGHVDWLFAASVDDNLDAFVIWSYWNNLATGPAGFFFRTLQRVEVFFQLKVFSWRIHYLLAKLAFRNSVLWVVTHDWVYSRSSDSSRRAIPPNKCMFLEEYRSYSRWTQLNHCGPETRCW